MNIIKTLTLSALFAICLAGCAAGSGHESGANSSAFVHNSSGYSDKGEPLTASSRYDHIQVFNGVELHLTNSSKISYSIKAEKSVIPRVKLRVIDGTLNVYADSLKEPAKIVVTLSAPVPPKLTAFNDAALICAAPLTKKDLELEAWNEAAITLRGKINADDLEIKSFNNAVITLSASVTSTDLEAKIWNDGRLDMTGALNLGTMNISAWNDGQGNFPSITAAEVEAEAFNSGTLTLRGKAGKKSLKKYNGGIIHESLGNSSKLPTQPSAGSIKPLPPINP